MAAQATVPAIVILTLTSWGFLLGTFLNPQKSSTVQYTNGTFFPLNKIETSSPHIKKLWLHSALLNPLNSDKNMYWILWDNPICWIFMNHRLLISSSLGKILTIVSEVSVPVSYQNLTRTERRKVRESPVCLRYQVISVRYFGDPPFYLFYLELWDWNFNFKPSLKGGF